MSPSSPLTACVTPSVIGMWQLPVSDVIQTFSPQYLLSAAKQLFISRNNAESLYPQYQSALQQNLCLLLWSIIFISLAALWKLYVIVTTIILLDQILKSQVSDLTYQCQNVVLGVSRVICSLQEIRVSCLLLVMHLLWSILIDNLNVKYHLQPPFT